MLTNQTISSSASSSLLLENHSNIRSHSDDCLRRFLCAWPLWRLCLQIAFFFFYSVWIVGLSSTPGESGFVFSTTHEREALHFKNSLMTFQHNQHRPFTAITLTLVVSRFLRETFWIFTHLDFFLVLIGKDVKLPNMVLYWTVMAWCFFGNSAHTDLVCDSVLR